jgi:hypothetical protein
LTDEAKEPPGGEVIQLREPGDDSEREPEELRR